MSEWKIHPLNKKYTYSIHTYTERCIERIPLWSMYTNCVCVFVVAWCSFCSRNHPNRPWYFKLSLYHWCLSTVNAMKVAEQRENTNDGRLLMDARSIAVCICGLYRMESLFIFSLMLSHFRLVYNPNWSLNAYCTELKIRNISIRLV